MSKALKKDNEQEVQTQLLFDPKRDINPFWRSTLFSDVYLKNDIPREYKHLWENDEIGGFHDFFQGFVDLCVETEHETFEKWKEADTVKNWIVHVMDLLGWENNSERRSNSYMDNESFTIFENGRKQTFRPDLIYYDKPQHKSYTQKEKDIDRKLNEARNKRTGTKIVVEAKYWDRLSQMSESSKKDTKLNDSASALGPELQTLKYMEIFNHDFGILTDGKTWRLFHKELSNGIDRRSFDFDLGNLRELALDIGSHQNEEKFRHYAKYFYYFFSKESLVQNEESKTVPFVFEVFQYSRKYAHSIEEDLKKKFILSMGHTCNALSLSCKSLDEKVDLEKIRNVAESHLFNILFVKSCEVRRILPISSTQYLRVSLHEVIETMDAMNFDPDKDWDDYLRDFKYTFGKKFDFDGFDIFNRFINLYEIIHDGTSKTKDFGFEVEGFKESVFTKDEWRFAKKHKLRNRDMIRILFSLNFIESSFKGRKFQQIPYSYFTPRQLGSIYESFLDYKLEEADVDMVFTKKQWKQANLKSEKVRKMKLLDEHFVKSGELYFSPDNKERKMTGSYYTPDYVVKEIIQSSIAKKVKELSSDEILNFKVCDPAMGSGHFLAGAIDYLVGEYRSTWSLENNDDLNESMEATSRRILQNCIYGVDLNKRAVKLAKMSFWLMTATPGCKLEELDDQIKVGNSLLGFKWEKEFKNIFKKGGFDSIIGNPPYIRTQNLSESDVQKMKKDFSSAEKGNFDVYALFIEKSLELLSPDGIIGLILPNKFFTADYGEPIRRIIRENGSLDRVVDFKDFQVFDSATTYTCLLYLSNSESKAFQYGVYEGDFQSIKYEEGLTEELDDKAWNFLSGDESTFFSELKKQPLVLSRYADKVFQGIATSADAIYIMELVKEDKDYYWGKSKEHKKVFKIEKGVCLPVLKGAEISKYSKMRPSNFVIFPYSIDGDKYSGFTEQEMKNKFPSALDYLSLSYEKLLKRSKCNESNWWLYPYPKNILMYCKPKLILQVLSKTGNFILDSKGEFCFVGGGTAGGNAIYADLSTKKYKVLMAILNSLVLKCYVHSVGSQFRGGYFSFGKSSISDFPIPDLESIDKKVENEIVNIVVSLERKYSTAKERELNEVIMDLYGLSDSSKNLLFSFDEEEPALENVKAIAA